MPPEQQLAGALVITTINAPTQTVVRARELLPDWRIVVVGDGKTPADWQHEGVEYLSLEQQRATTHRLAASLPVGHYSRKNVGYLEAIAGGAPVIAETDDDNFPYDDFLVGLSRTVRARPVLDRGWVNVYRCFTDRPIWPRGLPLPEVLPSQKAMPALGEPGDYQVPVQQFLADGDPDVDAIYRLVVGEAVTFDRSPSVVLPPGTHCPFNSQNTVWFPEAYPLLYLPSNVSFRMTDIWRSFVAARCLAAAGAHLGFAGATVFQERNVHDLHRDFVGEVDGYLHNDRIVQELARLELTGKDHCADLRACYVALCDLEIIDDAELLLVDAWIEDIDRIQHGAVA